MAANTLVRDVMSTSLATVRPEQPVAEAADILAAKGVSALPVVDDTGRFRGLLRDDDLIVSEARVHVPAFVNFLGLGMALPGEMKQLEAEIKKIAGATVADVMTKDAPTVGLDNTLEDAATIMHDEGAVSLPVVDADGKVVGIVARGDVVRFIARTT
jgi:CBS domain-containing protein